MRALLAAALSILFVSIPTLALEYEEVSYDDLLQELNTQSRTFARPKHRTGDFFSDVKIHAGLGFINSQLGIEFDDKNFFRSKSGFQLAVGIDLASPFWQLEGAVRNYGYTENHREYYSLREFDLRIVYQRRMSHSIGYRFGTGLAARYLTYQRRTKISDDMGPVYQKPTLEDQEPESAPRSKLERISSSTPSAIAFAGLDYFVSENLSVGMDFNARSSMIQDTADRMALDLTLRVDTHF